jgi:hypothetical protein
MSTMNDDWPSFAATSIGERSDTETLGDDGLAASYARCFATLDGRRVLAHLRGVTFERVFGPDASEARLRHAEGQRQLVAAMVALARRGRGSES